MEKDLHNNILKQLKDFDVPWSKSKNEVWQNLEARIDESGSKTAKMPARIWIYAAAAIFILVLSSGLFIRFFETTIETSMAEYVTHQLPDGSTIEMNAESVLSYHPYWWRFKRELSFEGEGFFQVQKGSKFTVVSGIAETEVLGTSFTIFSRINNYEVACYTGKVNVTTIETRQSQLLMPNQQMKLNHDGQIEYTEVNKLKDPLPWKSGKFIYTGSPISQVIDEIQRQYGVKINYSAELNFSYTGEINVRKDLHTTLDLVCIPFRITFEQSTKGEFNIIGKSK